ncbi:hypothetical protein DFJ74DRAFT_592742, partial [Hyaloraphidium curvatum]
PRWYNQAFLVFLALKQAGTPLPRGELIKRALELDKKIGSERGLPPCFTGKTPQNSCSAVLTENRDKYFVSHKPPGAPATIFSLAYQPYDFADAKKKYDEWTALLVEHDYPIFFGGIKWYDEVESGNAKKKAPSRQGYDSIGISPLLSHPDLPPVGSWDIGSSRSVSDARSRMPHSDSLPTLCVDLDQWFESDPPTVLTHTFEPDAGLDGDRSVEDASCGGFVGRAGVLGTLHVGTARSDLPTSVHDIVEVRESSIPNAGRGVFAKRRIPKHTILGFYFGVPMTEDEFDCVKEKTGLASQYAIRYRFTVLDATDEKGEPYPPFICPFHYINEDPSRRNAAFKEGNVVNQIYVEAIQDIEPGEEIFVSYGTEIDRW